MVGELAVGFGVHRGHRRMTIILAFLAALCPPALCLADQFISEQEISEALLGRSQPPADLLGRMDLNEDGRVDVADLVRWHEDPPNALPKDLAGYTWLISAAFTPAKGHKVPVTYPFALKISSGAAKDNQVLATEIPGFDPTKGLLAQELSDPGEIPGQHRPRRALSQVVPPDTTFTFEDSVDEVKLVSEEVVIPADAKTNPTGVELRRKWTVTVDKQALASGDTVHGTVKEETFGFRPGGRSLESVGTVFLTPFQREDLAEIEEP